MKVSNAVRGVFALGLLSASVAVFPQQASAVPSSPDRSMIESPVAPQSVTTWQNEGVVAVAAGYEHTCAIETSDVMNLSAGGTAFCWGKGGRLGNGGSSDSNVPVKVSAANGFTNTAVTGIAAGWNHTCAVEGDKVWCWGEGLNGKLGNGATANSAEPVLVSAGGGFLNDGSQTINSISAGLSSTCVVAGNSAYCWGNNLQGQLGNNSTTSSSVPVAVSTTTAAGNTLSGVSAVSVGNYGACAKASASGAPSTSGGFFCWGLNGNGEIGDGSNSQSLVPKKSAGLPGGRANEFNYAVEVGDMHSCGINSTANPALFCWGAGTDGRLGNGATANQNSPVAVTNTLFVDQNSMGDVSAGGAHTCAIDNNQLYCWGKNIDGQLGDGSTTSSSNPVKVAASQVAGFTNTGTGIGMVEYLSAGHSHTCATENYVLYCWGSNMGGRLGIGPGGAQSKPVKVFVASAPGAPTGLYAMSTGTSGSLSISGSNPSNDGGSAITAYDYTLDDGATTTQVARTGSGNAFSFTITGLTDGTQYSIKVRAVNALGTGPWSTATTGTPGVSSGGGGSPSPFLPPSQLDGASASATMTSDGVVVTFTGIPATGLEAVEIQVGPTSADLRGSMTIDSWFFGDGPPAYTPGELPTVVNGSFSVTVPSIATIDASTIPATRGSQAFAQDGDYHLLFGVYGDSWEYATMMQGDPLLVARGSDSSSGGSSSTVPSTSGGGSTVSQAPSLVTSANQEQVAAPAGSAKLLVNGELVEVDLVQAPEALRRTAPGARTFAEVRALQALAQDMVAAVQAVLGEGVTLPITVTNTSTGATITGVVSDPVSGEPLAVPVEDVLLIVNESIALMVGGADGAGDPANIAFDGVLEFGEGGYVAVLAYGLTPGAAGEVVVMSTPRLLDTFAVGTDGGVAVQTQIPTDLEAGDHTVVVAIDGQSASLGFRVLAPGILPSTGSDSTPLPWAVLVLAAGAFAVLTVTRRRATV